MAPTGMEIACAQETECGLIEGTVEVDLQRALHRRCWGGLRLSLGEGRSVSMSVNPFDEPLRDHIGRSVSIPVEGTPRKTDGIEAWLEDGEVRTSAALFPTLWC